MAPANLKMFCNLSVIVLLCGFLVGFGVCGLRFRVWGLRFKGSQGYFGIKDLGLIEGVWASDSMLGVRAASKALRGTWTLDVLTIASNMLSSVCKHVLQNSQKEGQTAYAVPRQTLKRPT